MLPLLQYLGDKKEHSFQETIEYLADKFNLSEEEKRELLPSGRAPKFSNRVGWARTFLKMALLLEPTKRGFFKISQEGLKVLLKKPEKIDMHFLNQFPSYVEFRKLRHEKPETETGGDNSVDSKTPLESFETAYQSIKDNLVAELLETIKGASPSFFERLVVDLLVKMGYGGTLKDAGQAIGRSGDGGIDGIIKEDRLGLDTIYIQAKKWDSVVGRPEIQKFAGALQGNRAKKGIFLTTANYSKDAVEFASRIDSKIILIDGETLVNFMIDHNVGVSTIANYEIKKVDSDYFAEE
jgi:restriction system protein